MVSHFGDILFAGGNGGISGAFSDSFGQAFTPQHYQTRHNKEEERQNSPRRPERSTGQILDHPSRERPSQERKHHRSTQDHILQCVQSADGGYHHAPRLGV